MVKSNDENVKMTSHQVKKKVMREVSKVLNVRVKAVRKTRSDGIAIETMNETEMKKVTECSKFEEVGLKVELPRKVGQKVIVYDVPNEIMNEDLMKEVYAKNLKGCVTMSKFRERARVVSRNSKKNAECGNVIMEVSKQMKDVIFQEGRLFVNWYAFRVKEFINVLRWLKCYAYGHIMRECGVKERLCQRCCGSGHLIKDCKKESMCGNCKARGKKCDHSVMSNKCPEFVRLLERERLRVNNG